MSIIEDGARIETKTKKVKPSQAVAASTALPHVPAVPTMMDLIARAAADPSIDVAKLNALLDIRDREEDRAGKIAAMEAEAAFNAAMAQVQGKMLRVAADANNSQTKSKYATYAALDRALRPLYAPAGFALSFNEEQGAPADYVRVVCYLTHTAPEAKRSHTRKYHVDMPADGKGAKGGDVMTKTHAHGSAFTYGQRYLLKMIFNIAVGQDDDGNAASETDNATITALQLKEIKALIAEVNASEANVCKACHVQTLEDLTVKQFEKAKAKLESMRAPL